MGEAKEVFFCCYGGIGSRLTLADSLNVWDIRERGERIKYVQWNKRLASMYKCRALGMNVKYEIERTKKRCEWVVYCKRKINYIQV